MELPSPPRRVRGRGGRGFAIRGRGQRIGSNSNTGDLPHIGEASTSSPVIAGLRMISKRQKRTRRTTPAGVVFTGEDYDPSDDQPKMDNDGILDVNGERPTRKMVITQSDNLRLREAMPGIDDSDSTDDSIEDP